MTDRLTIHNFEVGPAYVGGPTAIRFRLSNGLCSQVPRTRFPQLACLSERSLAREFAREPGKVVWTSYDVSLTAEQLADAGLHPDPLEETLMSPSKEETVADPCAQIVEYLRKMSTEMREECRRMMVAIIEVDGLQEKKRDASSDDVAHAALEGRLNHARERRDHEVAEGVAMLTGVVAELLNGLADLRDLLASNPDLLKDLANRKESP